MRRSWSGAGPAASENAWFAARIPGGPGTTANTGTMTGHAAASGQKSPSGAPNGADAPDRKGAFRASSADRTHLAPSRRSTPLIWGTEKENEGRPGARLHRDAERWLLAV
jgi:hypothetical protein